jgi:hypothetical protein
MKTINKRRHLVAIRKIDLLNDSGKQCSQVVVKIYKPQWMGAEVGVGYACYYQIVGICDERVRFGAGTDAVQAMLLTFTRIGANLYTSRESRTCRLKWCHGGNLGFPVFQSQLSEAQPDQALGLLL